MSMDLTGITNQNEYYTNHYLASIFEENAAAAIAAWRTEAGVQHQGRTRRENLYPVHHRRHPPLIKG